MLCMALSSCGEEANSPVVPETAPLSVTSEEKTREQYEDARKQYEEMYGEYGSEYTMHEIVMKADILTANKVPVDTLFPINIGIAFCFSTSPVFKKSIDESPISNYDPWEIILRNRTDSHEEGCFEFYTNTLSKFEESGSQDSPRLCAKYDVDNTDHRFSISLDEYFERKTNYLTTIYAQCNAEEAETGVIRITFYSGWQETLSIYYATDGEYIAYSVESVEAAQDALLKD